MIRTLLVLPLLFGLSIAYADINQFDQVSHGIYRGGQPQDFQDYQLLKSVGVRTILNLRTTESDVNKERRIADDMGIEFKNIPISGFFAPSDKDIKSILNFMTDTHNQPVFVHCQYGQDRTGLVVGLYRVWFEGWSPKDAYAEMEDHGFKSILLGLTGYFWTHVGK